MLPTVVGERLFDNMFGDGFGLPAALVHDRVFGKHGRHLMKADVRELENSYELDIDLPGFKKDEISVELDDGTLSICACKGQSHEEEKPGQYIRRERSFGECRRSFYVGDGIEPKDVCAKYEDGILRLTFPKAPEKKEPEDRKVAIQ